MAPENVPVLVPGARPFPFLVFPLYSGIGHDMRFLKNFGAPDLGVHRGRDQGIRILDVLANNCWVSLSLFMQ